MLPPLPDCVTHWREEVFTIEDQEIRLTIPANPDALLDDPAVLAESEQNDFVPYWASLWPAARIFSELLLTKATPPAANILELGSGCGLVGLAAIAAGMHVTLSDYREESLQVLAHNAAKLEQHDYQLQLIDWFQPPSDRYPAIIASDVLYEERLHEPLLDTLDQMLEPGGFAWIADPGRSLVLDFVRTAQKRNWEFDVFDDQFTLRSFPAVGKFQLLLLNRASSR